MYLMHYFLYKRINGFVAQICIKPEIFFVKLYSNKSKLLLVRDGVPIILTY